MEEGGRDFINKARDRNAPSLFTQNRDESCRAVPQSDVFSLENPGPGKERRRSSGRGCAFPFASSGLSAEENSAVNYSVCILSVFSSAPINKQNVVLPAGTKTLRTATGRK